MRRRLTLAQRRALEYLRRRRLWTQISKRFQVKTINVLRDNLLVREVGIWFPCMIITDKGRRSLADGFYEVVDGR